MRQSLKFIWRICEVYAYLASTAYSLKFGWMQISVYDKLNFFKSAMSSASRSVLKVLNLARQSGQCYKEKESV